MAIKLEITKRIVSGKKAARKLRHEGMVPGIVYGGDGSPVLVSVSEKELSTVCYSLSFFAHIVEMDIDNEKTKLLPRDIVFDVVSNRPLHVDFQRISKDSKVKISIPVEFANEDKCPGIKKGGVLNIVVHKLDCFCSPELIPENVVIDLAGRDMGESFMLSELSLPDGVIPVNLERDNVLATIVVSKTAEDKAEVSAEEVSE